MKLPHLGKTARITFLVLIGIATLAGWRTYDYVQHDPSFCTSCHIMDNAYSRWSNSVHSKITCHECHAPKLSSNLRQLWVYWTDPPDKPRHRPEVENSTCYTCHRVNGPEGDRDAGTSGDPKWKHVLAEAGHAEHVGKQRIQCTRCHSTSLHKFVPPNEICKECHKHENLEKTSMDQHCTSCHPFKAIGRDTLRPSRQDCLECHEEMQVSEEIFPEAINDDNAPMKWACRKCHKPHTKPKLEFEDCRACHAKDIADSDLHAVEDHDECTNCHKPHTWRPAVPGTCTADCHSDKDETHTEGEACTECHD